jgi:chromate transporter
MSTADDGALSQVQVPLWAIAREWGRLGCTGFGGPPAHIALLRKICVTEHKWVPPSEFEDAIATVNLLPGPASTQLAIFCAWRLRGTVGAVLGGACFIIPGLVLILCLSALFLAHNPPDWVLGAAAGAGAAVPAVALNAAKGLVPASWQRMRTSAPQRVRWSAYAVVGGLAAVLIGPYLVLVLLGCGLVEIGVRGHAAHGRSLRAQLLVGAAPAHFVALGGFGGVAWVAFKVGALSYGGGFVIVPLMQHDAVAAYHWMTGAQFLNAVALGQVTPGPVVLTTAAVGYAAKGIVGGLLATFIAFAPSFLFVILGGRRFDRLRANRQVQWFLTGAGPAVIGAIAGSAVPLGLTFQHPWQVPVLAGALVWLFAARGGVVSSLLLAGSVGVALALGGIPV